MEKAFRELINMEEIKWFPWIGENYKESRILLLGESHRCDGKNASIEKHENPEFTKICVNEMGLNKKEGTVTFYKNIHHLFSKENKTESKDFWKNVAFINLVQTPMTHVGKNRKGPTTSQYKNGWIATLKVVNIIKPKVIICFSSTSAEKIKKAIKESDFNLKSHKWLYKIMSCYAKKIIIENSDDEEINIIFTKHPARMNKNEMQGWRKFLKNELSYNQYETLF